MRLRALLGGLLASGLAVACGAPASGPDMAVILAEAPAETLAAYGLFSDAAGKTPVAGVTGYDLINPLFSDHASKDRYVYVPDGKRATWQADDVFDFPVGTVLVKSFGYAETGTIETRLLIHKAEGWKAFPYVWNEAHTEARYRPIGAKRTVETTGPDGAPLTINYAVPNQNQCKTCHQSGDALTPIGPRARNLGEDQVSQWASNGALSGVPASFESVPSIAMNEGDVGARARAYLDINCGHCHKADGAASNSGLWLEWTEDSLTKLGIGKHPTAAGRGAGRLDIVVAPGAPDASILAFRMASAEPGVAMPELGRTLVHDSGVELVREWIADLDKN